MPLKGHVPVRMCVFCRKRLFKDTLRRFVFRNGMIVEDREGIFQGRGAYCCNSPECLERLARHGRKVLSGALKKGNQGAKALMILGVFKGNDKD